jgi:hypothetical protein
MGDHPVEKREITGEIADFGCLDGAPRPLAPLVFSEQNADTFVGALDDVLQKIAL